MYCTLVTESRLGVTSTTDTVHTGGSGVQSDCAGIAQSGVQLLAALLAESLVPGHDGQANFEIPSDVVLFGRNIACRSRDSTDPRWPSSAQVVLLRRFKLERREWLRNAISVQFARRTITQSRRSE
jgi:hypothetical protein